MVDFGFEQSAQETHLKLSGKSVLLSAMKEFSLSGRRVVGPAAAIAFKS
jgi:hypothetical protein